jgi:hypothetical protein
LVTGQSPRVTRTFGVNWIFKGMFESSPTPIHGCGYGLRRR